MALASAGGAVGVAALGWVLMSVSVSESSEERKKPQLGWTVAAAGDALARLSYDLLFVLRGAGEEPGARIVFLDESAGTELGQTDEVWDRSVHTKLVRRLTREGARAVVFDIVFRGPSKDPAVDAEFAEAIAENGRVFLAAALETEAGVNARQQRVEPPPPALRRAAAGWGLITFRPIDPDHGVRRIYAGTDQVPSLTWRAAQFLGAKLPATSEARAHQRWLNYYGPANSFPNIGYDRALSEDEVPPGFFRDQIVCIGGRPTLGSLGLGKDEFRTPYGLFGEQFITGVEIHATTLMNLLRGEWLRRLTPGQELAIVLCSGLLLGGGLPWLRPTLATGAALAAAAATLVAAMVLFNHEQLWFPWLVPAGLQSFTALGWAVGARYFVEERRRRKLLEAFGRYLSPQMAGRIADEDFDLTPGGKEVTATVMFTDLENYCGLCEKIEEPQGIARLLNTYFTRTIGHILDSDGTVIKYMGDSVQAVWGTPLPDAGQARKAVRAAWRLHTASLEACEGHSLRTRIGLHSGAVLAGNLGSAERFDFAVIGGPVNLASRFEGLNKYLGTDILVSESVRAELDGEFDTRPLGLFRVAGTKIAQSIHEVLGPSEGAPARPWLGPFAAGLAAFQRGDLDAAERALQAASEARPGGDRPAQFLLAEIAALRRAGLPADWAGVVDVARK